MGYVFHLLPFLKYKPDTQIQCVELLSLVYKGLVLSQHRFFLHLLKELQYYLLLHRCLKVSCFTSCINFKGFFILICSFGRSGGTRTHNLRFWRPALYQLNYAPKRLFYYFSNYSSSYCFSTFSNSKVQIFTHCDRSN